MHSRHSNINSVPNTFNPLHMWLVTMKVQLGVHYVHIQSPQKRGRESREKKLGAEGKGGEGGGGGRREGEREGEREEMCLSVYTMGV